MRFGFLAILITLAWLIGARFTFGDVPGFTKSYAVVIGVDNYLHPKWPKLTYGVKDAEGVAEYLRSQGFEVTALFEKRATRQAIVAAVEDHLVPKLTARDRVLFFFAGHGITRIAGEEQRGYLVPYDGSDSFASLVPMSQIRDFSAAMAVAKHQLFILDACFGGLLAMRGTTVDPRTPNYVDEVTKRKARQVLTAGGANQRVVDGGPGGHSLFTGQLLKALREGLADYNGDGYITFSELSGYIQVAASQYNQTPGVSELSGHEQGDFVFINAARKRDGSSTSESAGVISSRSRSPDVDVYDLLKVGKEMFRRRDYAAARAPFAQAAEMGNAEAMAILGKMYWDGLGGPKNEPKARELLEAAADKGDTYAMTGLANISSGAEAERWRTAADEGERVKRSMVFVDPTGRADRGEPRIPASDIVVRPSPPRNFQVR